MKQPDILDPSGSVQNWAKSHGLYLSGDQRALEDLAQDLNVPLPDNPRLLLIHPGEVVHIPDQIIAIPTQGPKYQPTLSGPGDMVVHWAPQNGVPVDHTLTTAVAKTLLTRKWERVRQTWTRWGTITALGGAAVAFAGERWVHNDFLHWGGVALGLAAMMAVVSKQFPPQKTPDLTGKAPPIRVDWRSPEESTSP